MQLIWDGANLPLSRLPKFGTPRKVFQQRDRILIARFPASREVVEVDRGVCKERGTGHLYPKQAAQDKARRDRARNKRGHPRQKQDGIMEGSGRFGVVLAVIGERAIAALDRCGRHFVMPRRARVGRARD